MKFIKPSIMYGKSAETEISSRLDSMHSKFMLRRENAFEQLIQKYEKPIQSPVIDLKDYKTVDVPTENASIWREEISEEEPVSIEISQNEKEELSAIIKIVQNYKPDIENDSYSFCGNSTKNKTSTIKSIKIRQKQTIERLSSATLKGKITDTPLSSKSKAHLKQIQSIRPVRQCRKSSGKQDETQLKKVKQQSRKRILRKKITLQREVSISRETDIKSNRPVRQCRLKSTKIVVIELSDDESDSSESLSPEYMYSKRSRKKSVRNKSGNFDSPSHHVQLKRLRKGVSISGLTITKQDCKSSTHISPYSLRVRKQKKDASEGAVNTNTKHPAIQAQLKDTLNIEPAAEHSLLSVRAPKCTCHKSVSPRTQPSRRCKQNSPFCQKSCSYCTKKIMKRYEGKLGLKECSVVCEKMSNFTLSNILSQEKKIVISEHISSKNVSKMTDNTGFNSKQVHVSNSDNHNANVSSINMDIVLETSEFSSKTHSLVNGKSTEVTLSHNYKKNSFVSLSSRSIEQSPKNTGHFSFLNRSNTFVTLSSTQNTSCLTPANLSMSTSQRSYTNYTLLNIQRLMR